LSQAVLDTLKGAAPGKATLRGGRLHGDKLVKAMQYIASKALNQGTEGHLRRQRRDTNKSEMLCVLTSRS